jgi:hypothetical protein
MRFCPDRKLKLLEAACNLRVRSHHVQSLVCADDPGAAADASRAQDTRPAYVRDPRQLTPTARVDAALRDRGGEASANHLKLLH